MSYKELVDIAKKHGYTYQGYWDGMYHFAKRIDQMSTECLKNGYKCLKCTNLDIEKGTLEWMLKNDLTR